MIVDYGGCPVEVPVQSIETLTEHERCARLAEHHAEYWKKQAAMAGNQSRREYCEGANFAAMSIASVIRSGK